jgi:hypothetical protein
MRLLLLLVFLVCVLSAPQRIGYKRGEGGVFVCCRLCGAAMTFLSLDGEAAGGFAVSYVARGQRVRLWLPAEEEAHCVEGSTLEFVNWFDGLVLLGP